MKVFDVLERRRGWNEEERLILDAVQRLCDEVIAPKAAEIDRTGDFPWAGVKAINAYDKLTLPEQPLLLFEFHGTEHGVQEPLLNVGSF